MALICCPVGVSEEINAGFNMKNLRISKIDTENDKNQRVYIFLIQIFDRICGLER